MKIRTRRGSVEAAVAAGEAPLEAVRAAALVLSDRAYVSILEGPRKGLRVVLEPMIGAEAGQPDGLGRAFRDELEAQRLRRRLSERGRAARARLIRAALR